MNQFKVHVRHVQQDFTVMPHLVQLLTMLPTSVQRDFSVQTERDIQRNSHVLKEHSTIEQA
ncbi:hypothetical protein AM593_03750, partial [Mytilus galloprovincialis]